MLTGTFSSTCVPQPSFWEPDSPAPTSPSPLSPPPQKPQVTTVPSNTADTMQNTEAGFVARLF